MDSAPQDCYVFVYGTLKRAEPLNWIWEEQHGKHTFIGTGRTVDRFPLIVHKGSGIPFMLQKRGMGSRVTGEVFKVDPQVMASLDILEGYPYTYDREEHIIEMTNQSDICNNQLKSDKIQPITNGGDNTRNHQKCWMYVLKKFPDEVLQKFELLSCYDSKVLPLRIPVGKDVNAVEEMEIDEQKVYDWLLEECKAK